VHGLTWKWVRRKAAWSPIGFALCVLILTCSAFSAVAWSTPAPASAASGGCGPFVSGTVIPIPCSTGSGVPGTTGASSSGASGSTTTSTCVTVVYSPAQVQQLGLGPAPAGQAWAELACGGTLPGVVVFLVSAASATPQVTAQQLMIQAYGELRVPSPTPATAPPLGSDGLVGLPEWFWVPASGWHPRSVTVSAGPVWATVTATPLGLTFQPGAGMSPVTCQGPGTAYDPSEPSASQHTDCSYTYAQPSVGLPGNVYQASMSITWRVDWVGSAGAGGVLAPALSVPVALTISVAQGEALVTAP
jgi:hypothetical protein